MKIGGEDGHGDGASGRYQNSRGGASGSGRGSRCVSEEADSVGLLSLADCL